MFSTYIFSSQPFAPTFIPSNTQSIYTSNSSTNTPSTLVHYPHSQNSTLSQPATLSDASSPNDIHQHYQQCYQYQPTYILSTSVLAASGSFITAPIEFVNRPEEVAIPAEINPNIDENAIQVHENEPNRETDLRVAARTRYALQDMEDLQEVQLMRPALNTNSKKIKKAKVDLPKVSEKAEKILKKWFMQNYYDPYPNNIERTTLAKECGLDITEVNAWFKKARQIQAKIPCKFSIEIERRLLSQMQEQQ